MKFNSTSIHFIIILSLCTIIVSSCTYYVYPPPISKSTMYEYIYKSKIGKPWETSSWRKYRTKLETTKYDKRGNEIEFLEYGEPWCKIQTKEDSNGIMMSTMSGTYNNKIKRITFKKYTPENKIECEETWNYHNNKKYELQNRIDYYYIQNEEYQIDQIDTNSKFQIKLSYKIDAKEIGDTTIIDSKGRVVEKVMYTKGKFSRRIQYVYNDDDHLVTEYIYDKDPNTLWCFTETRFDFLTKRPIRKNWKVLNSKTERIEIYIYNRKKLLSKKLFYSVDANTGEFEVTGYLKYKYKLK